MLFRSLYGSGAMGGVINLITSKGAGSPKPSFAVTYGSKNSKSSTATYAGEIDDTSFSLSAANQLTNGFNAINPQSFSDVNQSANGHRNNSLRANLSQKLGGGDLIGVSHIVANTWTSLDGTMSNRDDDISDRKLTSTNVFYNKSINSSWSSKVVYSETKTTSQTYYRDWWGDRKSTRLNSSHSQQSRMPSSA